MISMIQANMHPCRRRRKPSGTVTLAITTPLGADVCGADKRAWVCGFGPPRGSQGPLGLRWN